mmetsp:Transcript_24824/g.51162  ORF Transcript_24824/g.51162 Transcript_24824/m.51162 type:complete len:84 (-) Transcript_24824:89-340(-)
MMLYMIRDESSRASELQSIKQHNMWMPLFCFTFYLIERNLTKISLQMQQKLAKPFVFKGAVAVFVEHSRDVQKAKEQRKVKLT